MSRKPLFAGLIEDEFGNPVEIAYVGDEPCYVVNDAGFKRHIPSEEVDRQVLDIMKEQIKGNEELISSQTAKMLGQEDLFTWAMIQSQLKNIDSQFENLLQTGIPEEGLAFMGMMGFRVVINIHGEVIRLEQPGTIDGED
ncbi:MAG: hypothetical protein WHV66_13515 [Anaerolineales bacterium]|jgi:hypothetical protein